jgi:hypothetical protein
MIVRGGEPIARIGDTGTSTGPHLHLEIRRQGRPVNPLYFLNRDFYAVEDLPFGLAAKVPAHVRVAYVSTIPQSKRDEMAAVSGKAPRTVPRDLAEAEAGVDGSGEAQIATEAPQVGSDGRMHARLDLGD